MTDETNTGEKEEKGRVDSTLVVKAQPVDPLSPPIAGGSSEAKAAAKSGNEKPASKGDKSKEILVRVVEDDALSTFESKTLFWGRAGIILGIVTLAVGIATLIVFYRQLGVMQTQLQDAKNDSKTASDHAREQLRAMDAQVAAITAQMQQSERAWVYIEILAQTFHWEVNKPLFAPVILRNNGHTPATNIYGQGVVDIISVGEGPRFVYKGRPRAIFKAGTMYPDSPLSFAFNTSKFKVGTSDIESNVEPLPLSAKAVQDINEGTAYIAVYGIITYQDIFGVEHFTRFCAFNSPKISAAIEESAKSCAEYNKIDNNKK